LCVGVGGGGSTRRLVGWGGCVCFALAVRGKPGAFKPPGSVRPGEVATSFTWLVLA